jgi:hypothetical protein
MNLIFIWMIRFYQKFISPILPRACRYTPSCSQYALEAFSNCSFFCAIYLTIRRILKCNPFFEGGYDPISNSCCSKNSINKLNMDGANGRKKF